MSQFLGFKRASLFTSLTFFVLLGFSGGAFALTPISMEEKEAVIKGLEDCIKNDIVYISKIKKYHRIGHIAEKFVQAWNNAKANMPDPTHTVLGINNNDLWGNVAQAMTRESFAANLNKILGKMFSHFRIEDAKESLEKELDANKDQLGITYRESGIKSPYQEYVVQTVLSNSKADRIGIRPGDRFCLCSSSRSAIKYIKLGNDEKWMDFTVNFYRGNPLSGGGPLFREGRLFNGGQSIGTINLPTTYSYRSGNHITHYSTRHTRTNELENQYRSGPFFSHYLKIDSFSEGYPGETVSTDLEFVLSKDIKNLVIDLRGNGGGRISNLNHLLSFFIKPEKPYAISVTKEAWNAFRRSSSYSGIVIPTDLGRFVDPTFFKAASDFFSDHYPELVNFVPSDSTTRNRSLFKGKVAIYIDSGTASAAEDFAISLKTLLGNRCCIFGQKSAGALLTVWPSQYVASFKIKYPYLDCLSVGGVRVEGEGIQPDQAVVSSDSISRATVEWFFSRNLPTPSTSPRNVGPAAPASPKIQANLVDSYWIAVDRGQGPDIFGRIKINGQIYDIDKKFVGPVDDLCPWLFHLSKPILEPINRPQHPKMITNWMNSIIIKEALEP